LGNTCTPRVVTGLSIIDMASRSLSGHSVVLFVLGIWLISQARLVQAAFVEFSNCLDESILNSDPRILQFMPLNISAVLNTANLARPLNLTIYGNVTGQMYPGKYPSPTDSSWSNPNNTFGKIVDVADGAQLATTLFATLNVLSYTPYSAAPSRFCESTVNQACPLGPAFFLNSTDTTQLPGYTVMHNLSSSYAFTTIAATTRIQSGQTNGQYYGCVTAYITPDIGQSFRGLLRYLPLGILVIVGIATISAAILSPWGTLDIFYWSSNFGRDEDVLRLVTPGFGDCLQYLQFIVFTGSLSLNYPGFYQPVISRIGWSTLLFNESLVTGGNGTSSVVDGIYQYRSNSKQGLDRMSQLIGMTSPSDAWADMIVWLVVIIVCVFVLTQLGFLFRWIYRQVKDVPAEDLRSKNWWFSAGNVVRIALGYFLLPLVALSMYQFVIASLGPIYAVALAAVVLVIIIAFTVWLVLLFVRTRPRSFLFDDLQTVLTYGPLYNTFRHDTATYALVPILVNFLRGIAIGAVQKSGVAQIILLGICEVVMILTLIAFRPYSPATSMNAYQTFFAAIRLVTIFLCITFVPSLNVAQASRGWIGYAILLIHACVLVFGFFLNAVQTLVEVIARLAGAGTDGGRDAARGGLTKVFGMRQLSRRLPRRDPGARSSMGSNAQILGMQDENKEMSMTRTRTRSISASSAMLLEASRKKRSSQGLEGSSQGRQTPDGMSTMSRLSKGFASPGAIVGLSKYHDPAKDPYYRPPRRNTMDHMSNPGKPQMSGANQKRAAMATEEAIDDPGEGSSSNRPDRDEYEEHGHELTKTKTDYAVREVDFYYGVRGPALSSGTRKLKTGPADPTSTASSARGWIKGILGGKKKEKSKGFEVVRSAKAPPPGLFPPTPELERDEEAAIDPYHDNAEPRPVIAERLAIPKPQEANTTDPDHDDAVSFSTAGESYVSPIPRTSAKAPALPAIETGGGIELPSRIGSEASWRRPRPAVNEDIPEVPTIPRRSSRRMSSPRAPLNRESLRGPLTAAVSPPESPDPAYHPTSHSTTTSPQRLPFSRTTSNHRRNRLSLANSEAESYMHQGMDDELENYPRPPEERPSSVGFVNQHRASDNIRYSPEEVQVHELSAVEYGFEGLPAEYQHVSSTNTSPRVQRQVDTPTTPWTPAWNGSAAADGTRRFSRFRD